MSRAHWVNALLGGSERLPDSTGLHIPLDMAWPSTRMPGCATATGSSGRWASGYAREHGGKFEGGADRYRSRDLTDLVQTQVVEDIRRTCEPDWQRRGIWNRAYYEARVRGVPTMLLELLSHQNFADMRLGQDPRFRFLVSRAVCQVSFAMSVAIRIIRSGGQPLPVTSFAAEFTRTTGCGSRGNPRPIRAGTLSRPDGLCEVYTRRDDGGFDNGRRTDRPERPSNRSPDTSTATA